MSEDLMAWYNLLVKYFPTKGCAISELPQAKKVLYFDQKVYLTIFWMYVILRLLCENLNWIDVKISFVWGPKHGKYMYAAVSFILQ